MSTVLIIIRKVWERWLTQNGFDRARQLKAPAAAHSASSAQHPTEWGSRSRASFLKVSLIIKLALFFEQVTTKLWMSLVTIVTSGFELWATKSHAGARSSTEEQPLKPPQASNLSATNPCHILPHCRVNFHARTRRIAYLCPLYRQQIKLRKQWQCSWRLKFDMVLQSRAWPGGLAQWPSTRGSASR